MFVLCGLLTHKSSPGSVVREPAMVLANFAQVGTFEVGF